MKQTPIKICMVCSNPIPIYKNRCRKIYEKAKFCSIKCSSDSRKKGASQNCVVCGDSFYMSPPIRMRRKQACSRACAELAPRRANTIKFKETYESDLLNARPSQEREKEIIAMRIQKISLEKIGAKFGITRERVRVIIKEVINRSKRINPSAP